MTFLVPSYRSGFAPRDFEPRYPSLWRGIVGAWCPSLGPTGGVLRDWSGLQNHGTLTNMDPATDWVVNGGQYTLDFDGVDDYVDARATLTGVFTVSIWANRRTAGTSDGRMLWGNLTDADTYIAAIMSTSVDVQSDTRDTFKTFSGFAFSNSVWFHLVVSRNAANGVRVWKDGVESTSGTQTIAGTFTLQGLGRYVNAAGVYSPFQWDGQISDAMVWSRAIAPNEIALLASRRGIAYDLDRSKLPYTQDQSGFLASWSRRPSFIQGGGLR